MVPVVPLKQNCEACHELLAEEQTLKSKLPVAADLDRDTKPTTSGNQAQK